MMQLDEAACPVTLADLAVWAQYVAVPGVAAFALLFVVVALVAPRLIGRDRLFDGTARERG